MKEYKVYVIKCGSYNLKGVLYIGEHIYIITDTEGKKHHFPIGKTVIEEV